MENEDNNEPSYIFWRDNCDGEFRGGMFFRSMGIGKFIKDCENKGYVMAGVKFDQSNNCEFIFKKPESDDGE